MKIPKSVANLIDAFESITTTEEVTLNKPAPDIFLVAADKLGVEGYECLVIEDAESGVAAAHAAGMKVIAIVSDGHFERVSKADLVVERFSEITPEVIDQL